MCSPPTSSLSDTQLCCRGSWLVRGVCMLCIACVCVSRVQWVWGPVGGWQIICREADWRGPSPSPLRSSFFVRHSLAPLRTVAQGHCNSANVLKVHDTKSSRVSQHFPLPLLVLNHQIGATANVTYFVSVYLPLLSLGCCCVKTSLTFPLLHWCHNPGMFKWFHTKFWPNWQHL